MPANKSAPIVLIPANTAVPAGTAREVPVGGSLVADVSAGYGGMINWRITNNGALGAPCVIQFQDSADGQNWYDYEAAYSKDLLSGSVTPGPSIPLKIGVKYLRAIAYGNTTGQCTVEASVTNVTSL